MNYYEILEIHPKASKEVVKAAYKSLMQRHHPDKNPDNAEAARHAALIAQAYGVIADETQRSAYDLRLKEQAESAYSRAAENAPAPRRTPQNRPAIAKTNSWLPWLLISVIVLSGLLILVLAKEKPAQPEDGAAAVKPAYADVVRPSPPPEAPGKRPTARVIQLLPGAMTVNLKDLDQQAHVLTIPLLLVKVGSYESEKFIRDIERRQEAINRELADRLAYASYEDLAKKDGESYLKKIILDALGSITGTNRFEEYPPSSFESPGRYGAVDIVLPEPFSLQ